MFNRLMFKLVGLLASRHERAQLCDIDEHDTALITPTTNPEKETLIRRQRGVHIDQPLSRAAGNRITLSWSGKSHQFRFQRRRQALHVQSEAWRHSSYDRHWRVCARALPNSVRRFHRRIHNDEHDTNAVAELNHAASCDKFKGFG
jgi:predicted dehydrogenase